MAKRVLHADDDEHVRRVFNRALWRWLDVSVDHVATAQELVARAKNGGYDLIFTDQQMGPREEDTGTYAAGRSVSSIRRHPSCSSRRCPTSTISPEKQVRTK